MIRKANRYAFRFRDRTEEQLDFLRTQYRYKNATEIVELAIESLYNDNKAAADSVKYLFAATGKFPPQAAREKDPHTKKGRKK